MDNPYAATPSDPTFQGSDSMSAGVLQALKGTKPWVRFCSIIGFIGTGLIFLIAIVIGLSGSFMGSTGSSSFTGMSLLMGIIYAVMGLIYLFPSIKLWKYGSRIADLMRSQSVQDLEAALSEQRGFWKLVGIMMIVFIGLYVVGIIIGVAVALTGVSSMTTTPAP
ncbi:MAG: DUF5362 family protein [Verrucomicrobiales bacterium]